MEPFLEQGHMAGKIICPNKKCGAKLGNYDWAGVCCSCKEWVVPVRLDDCSCSPILSLMSLSGLLHPPLEGRRGGVRAALGIEIPWHNLSFISSLYRYRNVIHEQPVVALFALSYPPVQRLH